MARPSRQINKLTTHNLNPIWCASVPIDQCINAALSSGKLSSFFFSSKIHSNGMASEIIRHAKQNRWKIKARQCIATGSRQTGNWLIKSTPHLLNVNFRFVCDWFRLHLLAASNDLSLLSAKYLWWAWSASKQIILRSHDCCIRNEYEWKRSISPDQGSHHQ